MQKQERKVRSPKSEVGFRSSYFLFPASCFLLLNLNFVFAQTPSKKESALPGVPSKQEPKSPPAKVPAPSEGQMPEVIIRGEGKSGVASEKPLLEVEINPDETVLPVIEPEDDLLKRQPEVLRNPRAGYSAMLANSRTILPGRIRLARDPVRTFYPLREIMAVSPSLSQEIGTGWELVITDMEGRAYKKYSGGGLPPGSIQWNGRSQRGEMIFPGRTYSTVINYKDIRGQTRNQVGEPFNFDGVVHQESKGLVISLALPAVFETKIGFAETETIADSGLSLLQETADYIKRYYFTYPIKVECYSMNAAIANSRALAVAKILASILLLPKGEIPSNGAASELANERIDVLIGNR